MSCLHAVGLHRLLGRDPDWLDRLPRRWVGWSSMSVGTKGPAARLGAGLVARPHRIGTFVRDNSLSLFFGVLFLAAVFGQSLAGHRAYNAEQLEHGGAAISYSSYLVSSAFAQAVMENWQSEFLQFALFIVATVWLVQRGSPESKRPGKAGRESKKEQAIGYAARPDSPAWAKVGGVRTWLFSNSLLLAMVAIFVASWFVQSLTGLNQYNDEQLEHAGSTVSWLGYITNAAFWEDTLQNWQSEFLAVGTLAVFAIYLRQRGSGESKPVGAPHNETETSG
jgi:membrane protein implicated in regulation of membrane protease activity